MQNKNVLIIGAGELQIPLINAAKKLGCTVIASDQNPEAAGFQRADHHIIADTMNADETLNKVIEFLQTKKLPLNAVATSGTDASYTVAIIAEHFELPGHQPKAAQRASNKYLMREALSKNRVSIPKYKKITSPEEASAFFFEIGKPCVIKPVQNMGARGASLITEEKDIQQSFDLALEHSKNILEVLIEEYINAKELSIDALIHNGRVTICGIADRIIEYPPYFVETGHIMPSSLATHLQEKAVQVFCDGIKALGLTHGAAKGDIKISEDNVWIIEIAGRLSGGFMSSHTFPLSTGIPLHEYMIRLSLGEELSTITPSKNLVSVERAIIPMPGTIKKISIPQNIAEQKYISHVSLRVKEGDISSSPKNNLDKAGSIIATAPTKELALKAIHRTLRLIDFEIIPEKPNIQEIINTSNAKAKNMLKKICAVCSECNGVWCKGKIPGVGGAGTGKGFINSYNSYQEIKLLPNYIRQHYDVDTSTILFGQKLSMPVLTSPIGGVAVNYQAGISELEFQRGFLKGAHNAGTLAMIPDPANPQLFAEILQVILENFGNCLPIFKPRADLSIVKNKLKQVIDLGVIGFGTDIDGLELPTFRNIGEKTTTKSIEELQSLRMLDPDLPFIVKGVLTPNDALLALKAGATHIVVSSHGGRIHDSFPNPIDMLSVIKETVGNKAQILIDGGIRSGGDVVKAIILGADGVLIGRPVAIHAVGGGHEAISSYLKQIQNEITSTMIFLGAQNIHELKKKRDLLIK